MAAGVNVVNPLAALEARVRRFEERRNPPQVGTAAPPPSDPTHQSPGPQLLETSEPESIPEATLNPTHEPEPIQSEMEPIADMEADMPMSEDDLASPDLAAYSDARDQEPPTDDPSEIDWDAGWQRLMTNNADRDADPGPAPTGGPWHDEAVSAEREPDHPPQSPASRTETPVTPGSLLDAYVGGLNEEQSAAALEFERPVLMLAGAGSGKTRSLIARLAKLLLPRESGGYGVDPDSLMVLTFTNKAAREMKDRLQPILDDLIARDVIPGHLRHPIRIGTFHSLSVQILRAHADAAGLARNFSIIDPGSEKDLARLALESVGLLRAPGKAGDDSPKDAMVPDAFLDLIEQAKNLALTPAALKEVLDAFGNFDDARIKGFEDPRLIEAYANYQHSLQRDNGLDFADLINATIELFHRHPEIAETWQTRIRHVLVDEFQDTNPAQMQWLSAFIGNRKSLDYRDIHQSMQPRVRDWPKPSIALAGDEDQTVYAFRGSDVRIILDFERYFPDGVVRKLETNYRCQPDVLRAANSLIRHNRMRREKALRPDPDRTDGAPVSILRTGSAEQHAVELAEDIIARVRAGDAPGGTAILARTALALRDFEDVFAAAGVPCILHGAVDFSRREEIRDMMAFTELVINPQASLAYRRIANRPARGISTATMTKLTAKAQADDMGVCGVVQGLIDGHLDIPDIPGRALESLKKFHGLMDRIRGEVASMSPGDALAHIARETRYRGDLETDAGQPGSRSQLKLDNLDRLEDIASYFWERHGGSVEADPMDGLMDDMPYGGGPIEPEMPLAVFHQHFALEGREVKNADRDGVHLMTLHGSKGLEFDHVVIPFALTHLMPHNNAMNDGAGGEEEERRLLYVGMTRARYSLTIAHPSTAPVWLRQNRNIGPSPFIREIDDRFKEFGLTAGAQAFVKDRARGQRPATGPSNAPHSKSSQSAKPKFSHPALDRIGQKQTQQAEPDAAPLPPIDPEIDFSF